MAMYGPTNVNGTEKSLGIYWGAHDPNAQTKSFSFSQFNDTARFGVGQVPENAGEGNTLYTIDYSIKIIPFEGDWFDATMIYRDWVLPNSLWTKHGKMEDRVDIPEWAYNITTWVNTHWSGNDIFNTTGGNPEAVLERMKNIVERFGLDKDALALHWYEWDTLGYVENTDYQDCDSEVTCGFDTHYPEYFPPRTGFNKALKSIQDLGVRVAPYINGRIFDQGTKSWTADDKIAQKSASKNNTGFLNMTEENYSFFNESYGSLAEFSIICPHTEFWQETISDVCDKLVNFYGTDGVYIDQIASAPGRPCFDKSHNHTIGGGNHWFEGYTKMLDRCRYKIGGNAVVLTEDENEIYVG